MRKSIYKISVKATLLVVLMVSVTSLSAQYNRDYFLWLARGYMIERDYPEAIATINALIRFEDRAYEGYFMRGIAKYNMGDLLGAEGDFNIAIKQNPVYTSAYTYRAITRSRLGNYDDALKDFEQAIDLRPDIADPYYSRGVTRLLNQQFREAIADFDRFIRQQRRVADAYINRGICYLQLRDTTRAFENFSEAISTNRNSPEGYSRRGALYMQQERYSEAQQDFEEAIRNDSTHIASYFNRAIIYNNINRPEEAIEDLSRVVELDPTSSISYFNRAIILSRIGDYNTALEDYDRVAELSSENVLVYFYRANLLSRLGEVELAEEDYTRAIELYPDFANAYLSRANIRLLLQDSEGAMRDRGIAERKIAEHKSKLRDSSYSIYSDTTYQFDRLLSFDTRGSFDSNGGRILSGVEGAESLKPLFKFIFDDGDEGGIRHREYYDEEMEQFIASIDGRRLTIESRPTNMPLDSLSAMERGAERECVVNKSWESLFRLGVVQSQIKQYTSAIATLNEAIALGEREDMESPFLYINRAATQAEMIEFISSIESSFQRISIDSDPANSLRLGGASSDRSFDYQEAMADIERAIELHPELAYSHYNKAGLLVLSGLLPEAYRAYSDAISLNPDLGEAYYNRGVVQIMMKDSDKGLIDISKAGELGVEGAYQLLERYSR